MKLKMTVHKIKAINELTIELPIEKGLYAITGQNGSGKSTVVTCASTVFFNLPMNEYLGKTDNDAFIQFDLNGAIRGWKKNENGRWIKESSGVMEIKGFYEGSIIFGNRFRNTNFKLITKLDRVEDKKLNPASEFIRKNLGKILQNDENFYEKLYKLNNHDVEEDVRFFGDIFYYQKKNKRISQFHMSTGENLLVSILNSIDIRNSDRASLNKPCILFLDEIELALHPSSLKRLVTFLTEIANQYNYAIYFSTHSIELISTIKPDNIFYLERHADDSIDVLNPCFPAYATRFLYDQTGYDYVILVEDDLARGIIQKLLYSYRLLGNKLVHVLPCGGYTNVIDLANEVVSCNLIGKTSKIIIILDGDVKLEAESYLSKKNYTNNIPLNYLPIESLEKYLRKTLFLNVDHDFFRFLNDYIFHQVSLRELIDNYKLNSKALNDKNGKILYQEYIDTELRARGKTREEIINIVVSYLIENEEENIAKIKDFLTKQLK